MKNGKWRLDNNPEDICHKFGFAIVRLAMGQKDF